MQKIIDIGSTEQTFIITVRIICSTWSDRSNYPGHLSRQFCLEFRKGLFAECCYNSLQLCSFSVFRPPKITQDAIQQHAYSVYIVCFPPKGNSFISLASVAPAPAPAPTLVRPRPGRARTTYSRQTPTSNPPPGWTHTIKLWYRSRVMATHFTYPLRMWWLFKHVWWLFKHLFHSNYIYYGTHVIGTPRG